MGSPFPRKDEFVDKLTQDTDFRHGFWENPGSALAEFEYYVAEGEEDVIRQANDAARQADNIELIREPRDPIA